MSRPTVYPDWATNTNYAAGPYAGNANKAAPPAGVIAEGFNPGAQAPAEWINDRLNRVGSWFRWLLTLPTTASDTPQYQYQDAAGNTRLVVDHNGYPLGGRISEFREEWAYTTNPGSGLQTAWAGTPWTTDINASGATGGALALTAPTASYNARYLTLTPPTTLGASTVLWGPQLFIANAAAMSVVMEFEFGMNAAAAGTASKTSYLVGLQDGTDDPTTDQNVITLYKKYNQANWQRMTLAAGVLKDSTLTSTAPTAGAYPTDRFRLEIQGSSSPYGAYQARIFINETLIGTIAAANLPGAIALRPVFSAFTENGAPVGSPLAYVGPVKLMWNRFLSGPGL